MNGGSASETAASSDSSIGGGAAGYGSGLVGGILDAVIGPVMANVQKGWSSRAARKARQWAEYMASTQYQRTTKDLVAAGINPILAVRGMDPASGGNVMAQTPSMPGSDISASLERGVSSGKQMSLLGTQAKILDAELVKARNEAVASGQLSSRMSAEIGEILARQGLYDTQMQSTASQVPLNRASAAEKNAHEAHLRNQIFMDRLGIPRREATSELFKDVRTIQEELPTLPGRVFDAAKEQLRRSGTRLRGQIGGR